MVYKLRAQDRDVGTNKQMINEPDLKDQEQTKQPRSNVRRNCSSVDTKNTLTTVSLTAAAEGPLDYTSKHLNIKNYNAKGFCLTECFL